MVHGVLLLDKPAGLSSNAALQRVRKLFDGFKAGHTGTLDPLATGLLPVCFGEATKFSHSLLDADKVYEAVVRLGFVSSTGDAEGKIVESGEPNLGAAQLHAVLALFTGRIRQVPPMHSALKRDGRPLYDYARAGKEVPREPREIVIKKLELLGFEDGNTLYLRVACSKGTYIRVLAQDIGAALGCGGYLLGLRRTGIADLDVGDAVTLEQLALMGMQERFACLLPVDRLVRDLPVICLDQEAAKRICNGLATAATGFSFGPARLYDAAGTFLGVGEGRADGMVVPRRLISSQVNP